MTRLSRSTSPEQTEDDLISVPDQGSDGWNAPRTGDPLVKAARPRTPRAKRDTRKWCKGKVGVEHDYQIVPDPGLAYWGDQPCQWRAWTFLRRRGAESMQQWQWSCHHHEVCTGCGRKARHGWDLVEDCPDYQPREASA